MSYAVLYAVKLIAAFLLWTLAIYGMHRLGHVRHRWNPLFKLHRAHHKHPYLREYVPAGWPRLGQWFLWLGDWPSTLDVFVSMTVPAIVIAVVAPDVGIPLLVFHYFYELFASEHQLDHNPKITGPITRWFAWGDFHLHHHVHPHYNYCLMITLWDRVFGTAHDPAPGSAWHRIQTHATPRSRVAAGEST